jgi:hypothetical protein
MTTTLRTTCETHGRRIVLESSPLMRLMHQGMCPCCSETLRPDFPDEFWCRSCDRGW